MAAVGVMPLWFWDLWHLLGLGLMIFGAVALALALKAQKAEHNKFRDVGLRQRCDSTRRFAFPRSGIKAKPQKQKAQRHAKRDSGPGCVIKKLQLNAKKGGNEGGESRGSDRQNP